MKKFIIAGVIVAAAGALFLNKEKIFEAAILKGEKTAQFQVDGDRAIMTGVINYNMSDKVKTLMEKNPQVKTIVMESVPGSINDVENLKASRLIREYGLNTYVPEGGMVASGGTDFFCAGVERGAHESAVVGVHSWAGEGVDNAAELPKDHPEHQKYLDYYREMGIPEDFYWFTIEAAPAESMHSMSPEELQKYGLITGE